MVSLMALSASCERKHVIAMYVPKTNMLLNATYANYCMCRYDTTMTVYVPHMNPMQSTMSPDTDIHTFQIIAICLWTNMSLTLLIHVPLHYYCGLHINPHYCTHNSKKTICNRYSRLYCKICTRNKYALKCHRYATYANYFMCWYETTISVCIPHVNLLQWTVWPGALLHTHFTLLAYAHQQICLSHLMYVPLHSGLHSGWILYSLNSLQMNYCWTIQNKMDMFRNIDNTYPMWL